MWPGQHWKHRAQGTYVGKGSPIATQMKMIYESVMSVIPVVSATPSYLVSQVELVVEV